MSALDFVVLIGSMLGIAAYGIWRTRGHRDLNAYLHGDGQTPWFAIGLSVMATQASAITFLSTPGQGYLGGLGFVQIYFGVPIALIIIAIFFLPIFRRLNVYTAYEFLGRRFDGKTRLLGAALFLVQRGLGAGLTIYAPAIVLTTVFGWPLDLTIICSGLLVIIYTVAGGSDAVTVTQKYQIGIIFAGMVTAFCLLVAKLPAGLTLTDTLALAGGFQKLNAVNFSTDIHERYTFWSGLLGGTFLMLSYFGTDQSQVQRYISGASLREGRLGLMFNAVCKIPMQFSILLIGVLIFVFYQFEQPPLLFNPASHQYLAQHVGSGQLEALESGFQKTHNQARQQIENWLDARHSGDETGARTAFAAAAAAQQQGETIRAQAEKTLSAANSGTTANDADYVFITFILHQLPHGVIGLLVAAFFAAALSSKSAELNALGSTTTIDFYRHLFKRDATDAACVAASKWFTAFWGLVAIGFALYAHLVENLIQAVNILGSIFYGVMLGLFVVAFFIRRVGGTAVFWSALTAQALVFALYFNLTISYLWYPLIGCAACVLFSLMLQAALGATNKSAPASLVS
jgi:Na+/proline symporter